MTDRFNFDGGNPEHRAPAIVGVKLQRQISAGEHRVVEVNMGDVFRLQM